MTTISNVNIVVQQGDKARDAAQSIKSQSMDPSQLTAAEQQEKEHTSLSSVPESEESDAINPDKQQREKNKKEKQESPDTKKKSVEKDPDATGRLLDTIV